LFLDTGKRMACGFGLYRADRLAVNEERVVGFTRLESELADRDEPRDAARFTAFLS
jgi:hypothetical protein